MATATGTDGWQPPPLNMENLNASYRWWSLTHFFLEWNEEETWIQPCFGINPHDDETLNAAYRHRDFYKLDILGLNTENNDERRFNLLVNMERVFVQFFKEVFELQSFEQGCHYSFDLCRIGLPRQKYEEIMQVVKEHGLSEVWELIFFIIAKAQDFYNEKVLFCESKEQQVIIRNINEEVNKAIELVDRVIKGPFSNSNEKQDKLLRINFIFQYNPAIQLKDPMLTHQVIEYFKEGYGNGYFKDWKLQLQVAPSIYEQEKQRSQFRFRFAKALYNFLTQTELIKVEGKPYPNHLIECVSKILSFSLIRIETKSGKDSDKIKVVRNWIKDHTLTPDIAFEKIEPNLEKLYQYFDKDFIDSVSAVKRADAIRIGLSLCLQFKTQSLKNEIIHIVACLTEWRWRVTQQLENGPIIPCNAVPPEYEAFKLFVDGTVSNKKIDKITFMIAGEKKTYELTNELPIHMIQDAVKYHYKACREDYETDIFQADIKNGATPGSFSAKTTGRFNLPGERFFPKFIGAFFNFLESGAPALEREYKPADRYYALIAKSLQLTGYFRDIFPEDWHLQSKVKYWHSILQRVGK